MPTLILQGPQLTLEQARRLARKMEGAVHPRGDHYRLDIPQPVSPQTLAELRATRGFDINLLPENYDPRQVRLFITDMDSTFINIECANEMAAYAGKESEVSLITAAAMRGEIGFKKSLIQRVKLLDGVPEKALEEIYEKRLRVNPGGKALLAGLQRRHIKTALVSGGFTYFTERLKQAYAFDYTLANRLEIENGCLTGAVTGDIIGAPAKAGLLRTLCAELGIGSSQVLAVGDGANDLEMLGIAGLGIAYHAKPKVRAKAKAALNYSALDGILAFL